MRWGVRALTVVSTLVLARLLIPEDFGVVALATAYIAIVEGVTSMPMGQALIRFRDAGRAMYDTAWTLTALRGLGIALLMAASAIPMAAVMGEPRLEAVIYVLALKPLVDGLENARFIDFQKDLQFARPAMVNIGVQAFQVVVLVGAAVALRNYWALVIGSVSSAVLRVVMTYALKPFRPRFTFSEVRALFGFSGWLTARSVMLTLSHEADKFIAGAFLNIQAVGLYHMGKQLATLPTMEITPPLTKALYPSYTLFADDLAKLRANAIEAGGIVAAIAIPIAVGVGLVAEELVLLALGEKWAQIIPILQIATPLLGLSQIAASFEPALMARSRTRLMFYYAIIQVAAGLSFLVCGVYYFGFQGLIYGWSASIVLMLCVRMLMLSRVLEAPLLEPLAVAWRTAISTTVMVVAVIGIGQAMALSPFDPTEAALTLAAKTTIGILVYTVIHIGLWWIADRPAGIETRTLEQWRGFVRMRVRHHRE